MKKAAIQVYLWFKKILGIDLLVPVNLILSLPWYIRDYFAFNKANSAGRDKMPVTFNIQVNDKREGNGSLNTHYFQQDLLVAQYVAKNNPVRHVDIGSRVDGFVAHIAAFREIETIDIRPQPKQIRNIKFIQLDIMSFPETYAGYCDSISSLHAFEHFGLGRYGDPINVDGHKTAFENVHKILSEEGLFYFSTPIGPLRVEFNAHRVFSLGYLVDTMFHGRFSVLSFSYIDDQGRLFEDVELDEKNMAANFGCNFGCGIFILKKIAA